MDSHTGFDEDEDFFGSYSAEEGGMSLAPLGFDDAEGEPPTPEQLAHLTRFRRPVAAVVASMALLSIVALGVHGARQHGSQRELVAHYGSSIAASTLATTATQEHIVRAPEASAGLVPEAWSALITEAWSALVPDASAATNAGAPALVLSATAPALELAPPTAPNTPNSEISPQLDAGPVSVFSSQSAPMCLLPVANGGPLARQADAAGVRPPLSTNRRFFVPAKPTANSALIAAPATPATFNSVARFPTVER